MKKVFSPNTFSFSLAVAHAWLFTFPKKMAKELGMGFNNVFAYKSWRGITWLKSLEEQEKFNRYIVKKLIRDKNFFKQGLKKFSKELDQFKQLTDYHHSDFAKFTNYQIWNEINKILKIISHLLCFYVVVYYVVNWPQCGKHFKVLRKEIELLRLKSEGIYDRADKFIKQILRGRIKNQYLKFYSFLLPIEIKKLLSGAPVDIKNLKIRAEKGYLLTLDDFIVGDIDLAKFLEKRGYYYPI